METEPPVSRVVEIDLVRDSIRTLVTTKDPTERAEVFGNLYSKWIWLFVNTEDSAPSLTLSGRIGRWAARAGSGRVPLDDLPLIAQGAAAVLFMKCSSIKLRIGVKNEVSFLSYTRRVVWSEAKKTAVFLKPGGKEHTSLREEDAYDTRSEWTDHFYRQCCKALDRLNQLIFGYVLYHELSYPEIVDVLHKVHDIEVTADCVAKRMYRMKDTLKALFTPKEVLRASV